MEEKHTIEDRYTVFEYNEKASPSYIGTRFMTMWDGPVNHDPESNTNIIAENVSLEDAQLLMSNAKKDSMEAFYDNLPDELKSPHILRILKSF